MCRFIWLRELSEAGKRPVELLYRPGQEGQQPTGSPGLWLSKLCRQLQLLFRLLLESSLAVRVSKLRHRLYAQLPHCQAASALFPDP